MKNELKGVDVDVVVVVDDVGINEEWIESSPSPARTAGTPWYQWRMNWKGYIRAWGVRVTLQACINEEWIESFPASLNPLIQAQVSMKNELKGDWGCGVVPSAPRGYQWRMNWKTNSHHSSSDIFWLYQWRMNWKLSDLPTSISGNVNRINEEWIESHFLTEAKESSSRVVSMKNELKVDRELAKNWLISIGINEEWIESLRSSRTTGGIIVTRINEEWIERSLNVAVYLTANYMYQ